MKQLIDNGKIYWQCEECGFVYAEKELAQRCERWCREHHACNSEIVRHAVLNKKDLGTINENNPKE